MTSAGPAELARMQPRKPAFVMAGSGRTIDYAALEQRSNRAAHLFRTLGLKRGDVVAILMENHERFVEFCWAAQRSGLYYCCVSWHLAVDEAAHVLRDSGARLLLSSQAQAGLAAALAERLPGLDHRFMVDGAVAGFQPWEAATEGQPATPITDESEGADLLYSSGTTGRPKGIKTALPEGPLGAPTPVQRINVAYYGFGPDIVYLSPGPLYHAAPLRWLIATLRLGATAIVMEKFDAEQALALIERHRVTHAQWVPTMFVRLLKLPEAVRAKYDISSLRCGVHAAAPCPVEVKERMIAWWGPILWEYYAGTEGNGATLISSAEWLSHKGSVGRAVMGTPHILDGDGRELPPGEVGRIFFSGGGTFEYLNDPGKTESVRDRRGWTTLGDLGHLDAEGYLYLTDRQSHVIISGGVNIYPQEIENLLVLHPEVADVAVIGVPNEEFGEEVKALVQPASPSKAGPALAAELIAFCRARLAAFKCPRTVAFVAALPRHPNGKLLKRLLHAPTTGGPGR